MAHAENKSKNFDHILINGLIYLLILLTGMVSIFFKDWAIATLFMGFALVFDPFDKTLTFKEKHLLQKVLVCIHLILSITILFIFIPA
ncbi:MAG: hypothetical protein ABIP95_15075 [Pelobium sp.]